MAEQFTPLPTPPSRQRPATFSQEADAFLGALPQFQTEANAIGVEVETSRDAAAQSVLDAAAQVALAEEQAILAIAAAEIAGGAARYQGDYDPARFYEIGESVSYLGELLIKKSAAPAGTEPVEGVDWLLVGGLGGGAGGNLLEETLDKSFVAGETFPLVLTDEIDVPNVSVLKEVPQVGVTNNTWDIPANGLSYDIEDFAYDADLTVDTIANTLTLSTGVWDASDVGKIVYGNGGEAGISFVDGAVAEFVELEPFLNENTILSGDWSLTSVTFATFGARLNQFSTLDVAGIGSGFQIAKFPGYYGVSASVTTQANNPHGMEFNPSGTQVFVLDNQTDAVYTYDLDSPYDLASLTYSGVSFNVGTEAATPTGFTFGAFGSRMFVLDATSDRVYQYTLSSPFDVSTSTFAGFFAVGVQAPTPIDVKFNLDGTNAFVLCSSNRRIYVYDLATPFDITTASYSGASFNVSGQDSTPQGFVFSPSGEKMFILGDSSDYVYEYDLTAPFDVTTSTYSDLFLVVGVEETSVRSIALNGNGGAIYVLGSATDTVYEYTLPELYSLKPSFSGFGLNTAVHTGQSFSVSAQDSVPYDVTFNPAGTRMFVLGAVSERVYQYNLSTPFEINTASISNSLSVSAQDADPYGITFNPAGTRMFMVGNNNDRVYQYNLSTPFEINTASYSGLNFSTAAQDTSPLGITFNPTGTRMFILGASNDRVYQYNLSTPFSLNTASYSGLSYFVGGQSSAPYGMTFNPAGTRMFILDYIARRVYQYNLSTPFEINTASYSGLNFSVSQDAEPFGITFNPTGTRMFMVGASNDRVYQYNLRISRYAEKQFSVAGQETLPRGGVFSADGSQYFLVGTAAASVFRYTASTPFDISTLTYSGTSFNLSVQDAAPESIVFSNDGLQMFVLGGVNVSIFLYNLASAFDITTATYSGVSLSVSDEDPTPRGFSFSSNGDRLYVLGGSTDTVYQYDLLQLFDISTASFDPILGKSFNVSGEASDPTGIDLNNRGTKMFILDNTTNAVHEYRLGVAHEVTSAFYTGVTEEIAPQDGTPVDLTFGDDGKVMVVIGFNSDRLYQYDTTLYGNVEILYAPINEFYAAITNDGAQINTTFWQEVNSMTAREIAGSGLIYYALSSDARSSFDVVDDTLGTRKIARDNLGTWEYNSNPVFGQETWTPAERNSAFGALADASTLLVNRMDKTQLDAVQDANHYALADTLDLAIIFLESSAGTPSIADGVSVNYDANTLNALAIPGEDYTYDIPDPLLVRITALKDNNLKVRVS